MLLLMLLLQLADCVRCSSSSRRVVAAALIHRGGFDGADGGSESAGELPAAAGPSTTAAMADYVEKLGAFMDTFESALTRASTTCKKSRFLGLTASAASVRQRSDRKALHTAHQQLREIYRDALSLSEIESRQHVFAAATLRLHVWLRLLLREPVQASPDVSASAGVGLPAEHPPPPELVPAEELQALYDLHSEIVRKPHGTVSEVVAELRRALEVPAAAHLSMLYCTLLNIAHGPVVPQSSFVAAGSPRAATDESAASPYPPLEGEEPLRPPTPSATSGTLREGDGGGEGEGEVGYPGGSMLADDIVKLQQEVAQALEIAEAASAAQQQQQAETDRLIAEHTLARRAAEATAQEALEKLSAFENGAAQGQPSAAPSNEAQESAAKFLASQAALDQVNLQLGEAVRARDEAASSREAVEAKVRELEERLRLALQSAAQAAASEGVAGSHAAQLAHRLNSLEAQHSQLVLAHKQCEQGLASCAGLERQASERVEAIAQLGREIPDGPNAPSVPLRQHREAQMELAMLQQRHTELQRVHAEVMHQLGLARTEGQSATSHARELQRRLEHAEAHLHAASAFQPASVAPAQQVAIGRDATTTPQGGPGTQAGATLLEHDAAAAAAALVSQSAGAAKAVGGSLFGLLSKGAQKAQEISKSFLEDVGGLQGSAADSPTPPAFSTSKPLDGPGPGRQLV